MEARAGASTLANPEGFGDAPFASMKELRAAVALWPLFFQNVEIEEFVLVEPTIGLVNLENGKNNWTFDVGAARRRRKASRRNRADQWAPPCAMCASRTARSPMTTASPRASRRCVI
jgi:uncharacterized protein involved in outer membrane biogenesis